MITIFPTNLSDLQKVREIALKTWPQTFANILTPGQIDYMLNWMYQIKALEEQVLEKGHVFLIANEGEKSLGFCAYELHAKSLYKTKIHKIYILPEAQGKGIGKKLIQEVVKIAKRNGDTHLFLNVNKYNRAAIDFYLRLGFYEDFHEVIDIGNGFVMDDVVMELKIA
ncbi:GNAT family N-acetyltransferase [Cecembia sp.]|uniref:GNAT family N-acetyltransferase n=1 Tax=Cecembia sp. TaxID=1898110 RepID=UPI0025BE3953|nr:GNAT family N-acetyltransferase [Cecembia sp.]